jgi:hypothetical protein
VADGWAVVRDIIEALALFLIAVFLFSAFAAWVAL